MVEETSLEVGSQAHTLSESRGKSNFVQQRIMMFLEKGITLTVWRIAPIRRSLVFGNFILFIITTTSASMVEETSLEIGSQAHTLPERTLKSIFVQQRFMMLFQRGITLTVWRITPIRRSFAFGIIGIILTYTFMFHGLSPIKKQIEVNEK
ncbi:hypothetical protein CEXT_700021 [Caerostris extrusa]|uniref:Uncharacterized protein n=1 Tax=Caerostris extrusa TaxID=172846 RepID=A0AAV4Y952_CAEEX|nr:hypothetical protein CEXT_700021 [Caerostris extrusa]